MADFMKMLQQAQQMQGRLQQMQEELEKLTLTASSGGGMVTATADGKGQIKRIQIDPAVVNAGRRRDARGSRARGGHRGAEEGRRRPRRTRCRSSPAA